MAELLLPPFAATGVCDMNGLENTADVVLVQLLPAGVDGDGTPSVGVDTVRGDAYIAEADIGGPGRDTVRRAAARTGDSGGFIEDRLCNIDERFPADESWLLGC